MWNKVLDFVLSSDGSPSLSKRFIGLMTVLAPAVLVIAPLVGIHILPEQLSEGVDGVAKILEALVALTGAIVAFIGHRQYVGHKNNKTGRFAGRKSG